MENCTHPYTERTCPVCNTTFCWECCRATNVHEGGHYEDDYMECPNCGHDYFSNEEE